MRHHLHPCQEPLEQLNHGQPNLLDLAESCSQGPLPPQTRRGPENDPQAHISTPEEQISEACDPANLLVFHQHDLASTPPAPHQHPQPLLQNVFRGSDLAGWLVERGLCAGRAEAQLYGVRLQLGGVLDHLTGRHSFRDDATLLYYFTQGRGEGWSNNM